MDATLHSLANYLIESIPTILFFVFLAFYLKSVFFGRMERIFEQRRKATEGARELARLAFDAADRKTSEFEQALQAARAQIHQEHEALRKKWAEEQAGQLAQLRAEADQKIQQARTQIAEEVGQAQAQLNTQVETLSEHIVNTLTKRRAA